MNGQQVVKRLDANPKGNKTQDRNRYIDLFF